MPYPLSLLTHSLPYRGFEKVEISFCHTEFSPRNDDVLCHTEHSPICHTEHSPICHTERSEVSIKNSESRDISAFSKPQYDNGCSSLQTFPQSLRAFPSSLRAKRSNPLRYFGFLQKPQYDDVGCHTEHPPCHTEHPPCHTERSEVSIKNSESRDISAFSKPQYDNKKESPLDKKSAFSRKAILASLIVAMASFMPLSAASNDDLFDARARFSNKKKKFKPSDISSFFVGLQFMYGDSLYDETHRFMSGQQRNTSNDGKGDPVSHRDKGVGYGALLGYSNWFTKHFGIKVYNSVFYNDFTFESKEISYTTNNNKLFTIQGGKYIKTYQINFNANVDAMVNFFFRKNFTAGIFAGASAGIQYWNSSRIEELLGVYGDLRSAKHSATNRGIGAYNKNNQRANDDRFALDMAFSAGLRANAYGFQTWELGVRVPVYSRALFDGESAVNMTAAPTIMTNKIQARQSWNIFARYIFNF